MKSNLKSLLLLIMLFIFIKGKTQTNVFSPLSNIASLNWSTSSGNSGFCYNPTGNLNNPQCSITICLGDSICFNYSLNHGGSYDDYISNHSLYTITAPDLSISTIELQNTAYTGPNKYNCAYYKPTQVGTHITSGVINLATPIIINVIPNTPPVLSANITPPNPFCDGQQVCAQSLTQNIINYSFSSTTNIPCVNPISCNTPNTSSFCFPPGNHQILYTVNAGNTCSNTAVYPITVIEPKYTLNISSPFPNCKLEYCFNVVQQTPCNSINNTYYWVITNSSGTYNNTFTSTTPQLCLNLPPDTYNVQVLVNNSIWLSRTLTVNQPAFATITSNLEANCTYNYQFNAEVFCAKSNGVYNWNIIGPATIDNLTSNQPNINYTFQGPGTYTVTLTTLDANTQQVITTQHVVIVSPAITPAVSLSSNSPNLCSTPNNSNVITITANTLPLGSNYIYSWFIFDLSNGGQLNIPFTTNNNTISFSNSNINQDIRICVGVKDVATGCENKACIELYRCCPEEPDRVRYVNTFFSQGNYNLTDKIEFSGIITINGGAILSLDLADVTFAPNTRINVRGSLNVKGSYLHACNAMWDGIYTIGGLGANSSYIYMTQSVIEDAKRAFVDSMGATINIDNVIFNKNRIGIELKRTGYNQTNLKINNNYFTTSNLSGTQYNVAPINNAITLTANQLNSYPISNLRTPYNTIRGEHGVLLNNANFNSSSPVTLHGANITDKLYVGVVSYASNLSIRNWVFQNHSGIYNNGSNPAGIYAIGINNPLQQNYSKVTVGGTNSNQACSFTNCDYGVYNLGSTELTVTRNNFNNNSNGIWVERNSRGKNVTIERNQLINSHLGIVCSDNKNIRVNITDNTLTNTTAIGNFNSNAGIYTGEFSLPAANATQFAQYTVNNNNITGYFNGIYANTTFRERILDNEVHLRADNATNHVQAGIRFDNTNRISVTSNLIDMPLLNLNAIWQTGILGRSNTTPIVRCNTTENVSAALKFEGVNLTAPGNGIISNVMRNARFGIWLDNAAEIGNQFATLGANNVSSANQWQNVQIKTFTSNSSNLSASVMFTRGNIPSGNPFHLDNASAIGLFAPPLQGFYTLSSPMLTCNATIATPAFLMQKANPIAQNALYNSIQLQKQARRALYENIKLNAIDVSNDNVLNPFVSQGFYQELGKSYQVDSLVQDAVLSASNTQLINAKNINNSMPANNDVDFEQRRFNDVLIDIQVQEPDSNQLADLENLATKCPMQFGRAVYQARSVLMHYKKQLYTSYCELDGDVRPNAGRMAEQEVLSSLPKAIQDVKLTPNPSSGNIEVWLDTDDIEAYQLTLYNTIGQVCFTKVLNQNQNQIDLSDLQAGTYFYQITQQGIVVKSDKLMLIK